jgi:DedD protein
MAPPNANELSAVELEIKRRGRRRLIGALTLGLLAIVFLPMIFDSAPKQTKTPTQEISIQIPSKEGLPPLAAPDSKAVPVAPANVAAEAPKAVEPPKTVPPTAPAPAPVTASVTPLNVKPATKQEPIAAPSPAKNEPVRPAVAASTSNAARQGFVVQVGAFRDADKVQQVIAKAKELKMPMYTDTVVTTNGTVTRVRVGPFPTRDKATSVLAQVKLNGGDGQIVPLQ